MNKIQLTTLSLLCLTALPTLADTLTCVSANNALTRCDLPHADERGVQIQSTQGGDCSAANAWGADGTGIWVNQGCAAVFVYNELPSSGNTETGTADVIVAPGYEPYAYYGPEGAYVVDGGAYYNHEYYNNWRNNADEAAHADENYHADEFHGEAGFHGGAVGVGRR